MKTMLLLLTLPLMVLAQNTQPDMKWVDDEIAAIKPPRKGVPANSLYGLKDPFLMELILNQPPQKPSAKGTTVYKKPQPPLTLEAIMNGRTAMIDGRWYKQNDSIYGYTIQAIGQDSVLLQKTYKKKKQEITLSLIKKNKNIEINAK